MKSLVAIVLASVAVVPWTSVRAQDDAPHATVVFATSSEPIAPVPVFTRNQDANDAVADQLFLHLVTFGPGGRVSGDDALRPALARAWHRVDPVTLVFDLDPRARWQDGVAVTAHDVVFTWKLATDSTVALDRTRFEPIASVEAIDDHTVRVRFKRASAEQVYTFGFLLQPLPAHLLEQIAPGAIATSAFVSHPIGDGPFRFVRRVPGQFVELAADPSFFLGKPTIARVFFRYIEDPSARVNLFLTGESDVLDNIPPTALPQIEADASARIVDVASNDLSFFAFNARAPNDTARPNPLFADRRVREALTVALDRTAIARAMYDATAFSPPAAESQLWHWITPGVIAAPAADPARARALLASAGWTDHDGDGIVDRNGVAMHFALAYPSSSAMRHTAAVLAQQMWRNIGVAVDLDREEVPVLQTRIPAGRWDVFINRVFEDPPPSSVVQSWSCAAAHQAGSTNYQRWCDSTFDRMVDAATRAADPAPAWRAAFTRMADQHPAIFFAAGHVPVAVHRRYEDVVIWPAHPWLSLWQWRVRAGQAIDRDR